MLLSTPSKFLFFTTLILGALIALSSNSWLGAWMGLEINLLSFIPLMTNSKNTFSTEASLKYFLIQALASAILLFSVILLYLNMPLPILFNPHYMLISSALLLKMGAAPFHFWFPGTMEGLNWTNCLLLMTWQKITPLMLLSYTLPLNTFLTLVIISSIIIGSLGGLNQSSLRKLMAYSSINHIGWMLAALSSSNNIWLFYFMTYSFLSISVISIFMMSYTYHANQLNLMLTNNTPLKFCLFFLLLSLGGLPPFLGFLPKWLVIQTMVESNQVFLLTIMVITTLLTLFFYLRLSFTSFLFLPYNTKWNNKSYSNNYLTLMLMVTFCLSTVGLPISSLIMTCL
uniref:NADH-ubiquinone oxidoreductase chain 2 n=1 Tax=Sinochlora szechwanensis TaxID=948359 RepID=A0A1X9IS14_9ORTH|nr:NADH dehydrogenase subunit 2 [Sinochlora szechwanensis]APL97157.1 NADH dehydrogenase subunit 2 [Sinochlora szechwanensis]